MSNDPQSLVVCDFCGDSFMSRRSFSTHITKKHDGCFTSPIDKEKHVLYTVYGEQYICDLLESYMMGDHCVHSLPIDMAKFLSLLGVKRSSSQERKTSRYITKYNNTIQEKYGEGITNISQSAIIKQKKKETVTKTHGTYENYVTSKLNQLSNGYSTYKYTAKYHETYSKIKSTVLEKYGVNNFGQTQEAKNKARLTRITHFNLMTPEEKFEMTASARMAVTSRGGGLSKPEKTVRTSLNDLGIEAKYNVFLWKYSWDMHIIGCNLLVEVQGTMWHAKPSRYKEDDLIMGKFLAKDIWDKDSKKKQIAKDNGFEVVEIWEDEIKGKSNSQINDLVYERLSLHGYVRR